MSSDLFGVGLAVVLLAFNAFFVGAEFALLAARRSQIEPQAQEGTRAARTTLRARENVSLVMAGAQLGMKPFPSGKLARQADVFSVEELGDAVDRLARLDHALKGGSRLSPDLELLLAVSDVARERR